jgi:hypothetical protein
MAVCAEADCQASRPTVAAADIQSLIRFIVGIDLWFVVCECSYFKFESVSGDSS